MRSLICLALSIYMLIMLARIIFSWIPMDPESVWARLNSFCFRATEPVLAPVRGLIPPVPVGGISLDLSTLLVFFVLSLARQVVC